MRWNNAPLRKVVKSNLRVASAINMDAAGTPKYHFWDLRLECGHTVERRCRYEPGGDKGWGRIWHGRPISEILPAPKRARCGECLLSQALATR